MSFNRSRIATLYTTARALELSGESLTDEQVRTLSDTVDRLSRILDSIACENAACGHYTCTEAGTLGYWHGNDPRRR